MKHINMKLNLIHLSRKVFGIGSLAIALVLGNASASASTAERYVIPAGGATFQGVVTAKQGDDKARAQAKKRYEKAQQKLAKRARTMEKQKAKVEKSDRTIQKIQRDLDRQAHKVGDLEKQLGQAEDRSRTSDVQLSGIRVSLNKERLKHAKLENRLHKEQSKLNKLLKKIG